MSKVEQANFPEFEAQMLKAWEQEKTFEASLANRQGAKRFSFYDGPPFANGLPHFGHSLVTSIKDSIGRYQTMRGYYVERRNGWDCHGLPVEFAIEKEFGVSGKKQILELGLEKFNEACRASVFKYKGEWEEFFHRIGRWTDTEHAYATIDRDYTESVWWMLGQVEAKKLLYRGYKSMPYCPRCETPLSNFELNEGYRDDVPDPSVYVKFELVGHTDKSFLAWTTTPWSLPANAALAVAPDADYVEIELLADGDSWHKGEKLILAKARLDVLDLKKAEYKIVNTRKGRDCVGATYKPLYDLGKAQNDYQVITSDAVSLEDGTGVLHVAPAYGEDDLSMGQEHDLSIIYSVGANGHMTDEMKAAGVPAEGLFFKEADSFIIEDLAGKERIWAAETFKHTYPFCYRCESPLLYFAITTWFVKVSAIRDELQKTAEGINWQPGHIKEGRFGKWLEGARDWAISRNRYWGAPLPIWVNEQDADDYIVVSSLDELVKLAGLEGKPDDLHRPGIDKVVIEKDGKTYRRVEEVFDCWFESGSMPVAQQHYPFEHKEGFDEGFPADYIGEGLDQTRLWFYVIHVLSTIAFDKPAYRNVLVNGMVMAADGQKLSKRLGNYPPAEEVFAAEGADTLRFYLLGNDQLLSGEPGRFDRSAMVDIQRNVFMTIWNVYSFLATYVDMSKLSTKMVQPESNNVLDQWLLARLNQTIGEMTKAADAYELARAVRPLRELIEDLSNWYVRRSRRRFSKSESQQDLQQATETLHYVLLRITQLLAPWSPFISDKLYRELTAGSDLPQSVHLTDWPEAGEVDTALIENMVQARRYIQEGLAERAKAGIKVRQPLEVLHMHISAEHKLEDSLLAIVAEEVNVKRVNQAFTEKHESEHVWLVTTLTPELRQEGAVRDIIRFVQNARKEEGLSVDDQIDLRLGTGKESKLLVEAIEKYRELISDETQATSLKVELGQDFGQVPKKVDGEELFIELRKA